MGNELPDLAARPADSAAGDPDWWRDAVFYQIYPRSFADANGDGVGDLDGIRNRLDHLAGLGVEAIWLSPFFTSPMADHGYDVADPRDVDPVFGDLAAFDRLVAEAHARDIKVTIDLVPNHSSDEHVWFQQALRAAPGSPERDRYVFRDGRGAHGEQPPNNWPSAFGGPAWHRVTEPDGTPGQWYLHLFDPKQPDLNWENPEIWADLETTLRFWLDRGVDGFRIDVAHGMAKPAGLPDLAEDVLAEIEAGANPHTSRDVRWDAEGVHDIHRFIRKVLADYPGAMAVGEVWVTDTERLRRYLRPDELPLAFDFRMVQSPWRADELRDTISSALATVAGTGSPTTWVLSNHDVVRHVTRYGGGLVGTRRGRAAALLQLALPGVAYLYQGDELALESVEPPDEALTDPTWERSGHTRRGRDNCRIPLPWEPGEPAYGFSTTSDTWLPMPAGWSPVAVASQQGRPDSTLELYRTALRLRREHDGFTGGLSFLDTPADCLAFRRDGGLTCFVNAGNTPVALPAGTPILTSVPLTADGRLPGDATAWLA
ncbi:glycoside hydrolase family 13 protein [Actinocatenispora comari]|uniref:Alpha-glucosidase AglA n=1 Tax=Actinocatenispora comari TaxID=2807577 RepID=A0A8J4ENH9_9ACTN|nr:glycoside hydrolase family 13 protein [Actinocatenispora comari]GIL30295.1 alpha-glucosidase AglA [Actinocatenispora comari]